MTEIAGLVVAAVNVLAGLAATLAWRRSDAPAWTWLLVRAGQLGATLLAGLAIVLLVSGYDAASGLLYLYLLLPVAVSIVAEQLRIAAAQTVLDANDLEDAQAVGGLPQAEQHLVVLAIVRREIGILAIAAFVIAFLALRATATA